MAPTLDPSSRSRGVLAVPLFALLVLSPSILDAAPAPRRSEASTQLVELSTVLSTTAGSNRTIRAANARWAASQQKRAQSVALPDPTIEFDPFLEQMTPDDEKWRLNLKQAIPPARRRRLAGQVSDDEASLARLKLQSTVRNALADAKETFFELYYVDRAAEITKAIRVLYERYGALAIGGTGSVEPALPESFRIESQRVQLAYDLVQLDAMRRAEARRLVAIMGLPRSTVLGATAAVSPPPDRLPDLEELTRQALQYNQELVSAGVEVEKSVHEVQVARLAPLPELMVGAQYMRTGGQGTSGGDPTRDPLMLMVGVSVPIWRQKYRAQLAEARLLEAAAREEREGRELDVEADVARAHYALSTSHRLVKLYRNTLLAQSRAALRSAEELHRSGRASLLALVETIATVHNFELAALRSTVDFYQNASRLERITGRPLALPGGAQTSSTAREDGHDEPEGED